MATYDGGDKLHVESDSDKGVVQEIDSHGKGSSTLPDVAAAPTRVFEAPESVRNMTPEQRLETENRLRRKIDIRLMPMIVIMYIMNYLDRVRLKSQ